MKQQPSVSIIQHNIAKYYNPRSYVMVPNVSFGLLSYEADMLLLSKAGYLTEMEIKRSWSDFILDFKKKHQHDHELVKHFYYVVPESLYERVLVKLTEEGIDCGIITYNKEVEIRRMRQCNLKRSLVRKLTIEEQFQLARLGTMRLWKS